MVLIAPHITPKLFPKLRYQDHLICAPSHFYSKHVRVLQTRTRIITTHNQHIRHASQIVNTTSENDGEGKTMMSDVVVKRSTEVYSGKKWKEYEVMTAALLLAVHLLCCFAPFTFNWGALQVAIGLDLVTRLLGVNLSFHRHLTHKSFEIPKWLEYTFAYCGLQALQGDPIDWVSTHRYHHQYCDSERDPHTPIKGFWFSHVIWLIDTENITKLHGEPNNVKDLEKQWFYMFLRKSYLAHHIALGLLLYALGGLPFIVWGMGVRIVWGYHMTWFINSACHGWGNQAWNTRDLSLNNWWVGTFGYGEGWHNNHHAFEYSARHGLEWWQIDITWYIISLLEIIGLATNVKLPTPTDIQRKTFPTKT